MKLNTIGFAMLGAAAALAPSTAGATTTTHYSGQFCGSNAGLNDSAVFNNDHGLENGANYDDFVWCPASWSTSSTNGQANPLETVGAATLVYTDVSSGSFACHVVEENWDGGVEAGQTLFSCSQYGGCGQDSERSWQGSGQLNFTNPVNQGTGYYATSIAISCRIPGSSAIRGYNVSLN
jgi:hypothetical protein